MPDVLIRNVGAEDLARLDEQAAKLGITRSEYLRQQLHREARRLATSVTIDDLRALGGLLPDLADDETMKQAWS